MEIMPRVNVNVLVYLTSFLRSIIENGMDLNTVGKYDTNLFTMTQRYRFWLNYK